MDTDDATRRRTCRERWRWQGQQGLAPVTQGPDGAGQAKWYIDRTADPRLRSTAEQPRHTYPDLSAYTAQQRGGADRRRQCVVRFRAARLDRGRPMGESVPLLIGQARRDFPGLRTSQRRLYGWDRTYQYRCDLPKLIDHRGGDPRGQSSAAAWAAVRDLFLHEHQPSVIHCWRAVRDTAKRDGWNWPSYRAVAEQVDARIPSPPPDAGDVAAAGFALHRASLGAASLALVWLGRRRPRRV